MRILKEKEKKDGVEENENEFCNEKSFTWLSTIENSYSLINSENFKLSF